VKFTHPCRNKLWYPFTEEEDATFSLKRKLDEPLWFIPLLGIIDQHGRTNRLTSLYPEQVRIIQAFKNKKRICVLKPRQIGCTTVTVACFFWLLYTSPDPLALLTLTHESGAAGRVNEMIRQYWQSLPKIMRPPLDKDNMQEIRFGHNGAIFRQNMAGGRGQARSFTNQCLHATEMGFWPKGSAVKTGVAIDRQVWASANATLHESPRTRVVVESTGDGPDGVFYETVKKSRLSGKWDFLFFPWKDFSSYQSVLEKGFEPSLEEVDLMKFHGLSLEQVAWRRFKIEMIGERDFRKEYPLTWEEPFLVADGSWFDVERLNRTAAKIPPSHHDREGPLIIWEEVLPGKRYYIGGDAAGGTGGDYAVWQVLTEDLRQVATYRSNRVKPTKFAEVGAQLSIRYNGARVLTEGNNHGKAVLRRLRELNTRCWKDYKGKDFWMQRGKASNTKQEVFDYAAHLIDGGFVGFACPVTVSELITMREKDNGNIVAGGDGHDDHADALCLALWNAKSAKSYRDELQLSAHERRSVRHRELGLVQ